MISNNAKDLLENVDEAIKNIQSFQNIDLLEKSYLAKFLIVFICGIYEETIEIILNEKISRLKSIEASKYIEYSINNTFRNPTTKSVCAVLKKFNPTWVWQFNAINKRSKAAFDSIAYNKNCIAHGLQNNITLGAAINFYNDSRQVIEEIDRIVLS